MKFETYKLNYRPASFQLTVIRQIKLIEVTIGQRVFEFTWGKL